MAKERYGSTLVLVTVLMSVSAMLVFVLLRHTRAFNKLDFSKVSSIRAKYSIRSRSSASIYYSFQSNINSSRWNKFILCNTKRRNRKVYSKFNHRMQIDAVEISSNCDKVGYLQQRLSYIKITQPYHSYLLASAKTLFFPGNKDLSSYFYGPVFANNNIYILKGGNQFFVDPAWKSSNLIAGNKVESSLLNNYSTNQVKVSNINLQLNPNILARGIVDPYRRSKVKALQSRVVLEDYLGTANLLGYIRQNIPKPYLLSSSYSQLGFSRARRLVEPQFKVNSVGSPIGSSLYIRNGYLLEKQLIGVGTQTKNSFQLSRKHSQINRIYIRDIAPYTAKTGRLPLSLKMNAIKYLDSEFGNGYSIKSGRLNLDKPGKLNRLNLSKKSFKKRYQIKLRGDDYSLISADRNIHSIYVELFGRKKRLYSEDYYYNKTSGVISILNSQIKENLWYKVGVTDGIRTMYKVSLAIGFQVFVDDESVDARVTPGKIIFETAPKAGQEISVMIQKPGILLSKSLPSDQVGLFVDKQVSAVAINLSSLFPLPRFGLIYSRVPLLLYGTPQRKMTIFCEQDVYLGDINSNTKKGALVAVISQKAVWGFKTKKDLNIRNVMIYSKSDGFAVIYAKESQSSLFSKSVLNFHGTMFFGASLSNFYLYQNQDIAQHYYYNPKFNQIQNFYYPEKAFEEVSNLPLLIPQSIKILHRQN